MPGQGAFPTGPDHDGLYEDLNGDGQLNDKDVSLFVNQLDLITVNEVVTAFDMNRNSRVEFDDIVRLFREIVEFGGMLRIR